MPGIDKIIIDRVLDATKIEEVVGDFVDLKKKGVRYLGLCPFHADRHIGSFVVYPKKQCFKCFVCGEKGGVVEFLKKHEHLSFPDAIRWLGKKYNIETDMNDFNYTPPPPRPAPPPLELLVLPKYLMAHTLMNVKQNTLVKWIMTGIHWDTVQMGRINEVLNAYCVGNSRQGMAIFWQIDEKGQLRTGKMMKYYPEGHPKFGHRDKDSKYNFDWIHSTLIRHRDPDTGQMTDEPPYPHPDLFNPDKQEMQSCYFGLHLLNRYNRKDVEQTVCIVESEKTALLMAIAYGNHTNQVWMACGGLENLTREKLRPIIEQRRRIVLYPDRDGIQKWQQKADSLYYDRVEIDTDPVLKWWKPEDGEKADIADVVIRAINESQPLNTIADVKAEMPETKELIDKLNLEVIEQREQNDVNINSAESRDDSINNQIDNDRRTSTDKQ